MGSCCSHESERGYPVVSYTRRGREPVASIKASFGEYRCSCGRNWSSRLSWQYSYQICKRCGKSVYPHSVRELRASDMTIDKENVKEHAQDLCQMCKELGQYCGNISKARNNVSQSRNNVSKARNNVSKARNNVSKARNNFSKTRNNVGKARNNVRRYQSRNLNYY